MTNFIRGELYESTRGTVVMCTGDSGREGCFAGVVLKEGKHGHLWPRGSYSDIWEKYLFEKI